VLADDPFVELSLHVDEPGRLFFRQTVHRDTGPECQDLGDLFFVDHPVIGNTGCLLLPLSFGSIGDERALLVAQLGGTLELLGLHGFGLLGTDAGQFLVEFFQFGRCAGAVDPHAAPRFVNEVDRFVREMPI
jgi:hypothetical protein